MVSYKSEVITRASSSGSHSSSGSGGMPQSGMPGVDGGCKSALIRDNSSNSPPFPPFSSPISIPQGLRLRGGVSAPDEPGWGAKAVLDEALASPSTYDGPFFAKSCADSCGGGERRAVPSP